MESSAETTSSSQEDSEQRAIAARWDPQVRCDRRPARAGRRPAAERNCELQEAREVPCFRGEWCDTRSPQHARSIFLSGHAQLVFEPEPLISRTASNLWPPPPPPLFHISSNFTKFRKGVSSVSPSSPLPFIRISPFYPCLKLL